MLKTRIVICSLLSLLTFVIAPVGIAAQCVAPPADMVNWWTGDDNTFDIVGGNHGILRNGATYGDGQVIGAFSFDGVDDYVEVANDPEAAFNFPGSFSIDAWINLAAVPSPQFGPIVSKWNDIGMNQRSYFLTIQNIGGQPRLRFDVSETGIFLGTPFNSSLVTSAAPVPLNTWVHVAGVFDASTPTLRMYINGQPVATDPANTFISTTVNTPFTNNEPVLIGAGDLGSNARDFFNGRIDEVELFDRALTQTELLSLYNAGSSGKIATVTIDVKPGNGDEVDPINLGSEGTTPVAVLSTETFDATTMDIASIRFAGAQVNVKKNGEYHYSFEDVNGDGLVDLMLHFNTPELQLSGSSTEATLTGTTDAGRCVTATDSIVIVP